ncbi:hypothetical protein TNCV_1126491 [Trichonephila clavipes]|nr:hypothetical protein TNCV_1126491 [Trichonephila clavipes]
MECRPYDIKIYLSMGKNFNGDENWIVAASSSSFIPTPLAHADNQGEGRGRPYKDTVDRVRDSFCRNPDKSIRQASDDIPFCSNMSLYTRYIPFTKQRTAPFALASTSLLIKSV